MLLQGRGKRGVALKGEIVANLAAVPTLLVILALALPWETQTVTPPTCDGGRGLSCSVTTTAGLFTAGAASCVTYHMDYGAKCEGTPAAYASSICTPVICNYTDTSDRGEQCKKKLDTTCWYAGNTENKWCQTTQTSLRHPQTICDTLGPRKLAAGLSVIMLIGLVITWYVQY
jgi:hypothetical protein